MRNNLKQTTHVSKVDRRVLQSFAIFSGALKVLLFTFLIALCACSDDEENEASLYVDNPSVQVSSEGGSVMRYITSNTQWYITKSVDWVHVSPQSGMGNASLMITVDPNPLSTGRNTFVYLEGNNVRNGCYFAIEQAGGSSGSSSLDTPQNVKATVSGNSVSITWNSVSKATKYYVYRNTGSGTYSLISTVSTNRATDNSPAKENYYAVKAANNTYVSEMSAYAYVAIGNGGDNDNDKNKPATPTGVRVSNEGNTLLPSVVIRWNEVNGATKYYIYKASSASGSYSQLGTSQYNVFTDPTPPTNGKSAFYKVRAANSAGMSDYSDYVMYASEKNDEAFSPGYKYGNCTATSTTITLRWENLTGTGYGKATKIVLRVWNPYAEEWQDSELSTNATSASFNYSSKIDDSGFVKCGIVVSNAKGSFTAGAKVYDAKGKRWLN